ncbi:MAG: DUF6607 family protein [Phycisphaeraceae bacterium]
MILTHYFRPALTLIGALAVLLAAMGMIGCSSTQAGSTPLSSTACANAAQAKLAEDRQAILGMAGEYDVTFDFEETLALREGYELKEPYTSKASELVLVIKDEPKHISMQHLLVVSHGGETHIVKHWRQDWRYEATAGYDFKGDRVWQPIEYNAEDVKGAWVQSVYQVDDSPRYWGLGKWVHSDGVSTWSAPTNRPLPRREHSKRSDYQVLGALNTHVVTADGWMHYQSNHKIDTKAKTDRVIALESGVNTYAKTTTTDFTKAREYWDNSHAYWAQVRAAWDDIYTEREPLVLRNRVKGDVMFTHIFDLADLYWGEEDVADARVKIDEVIDAFRQGEQVAQP